MPSEKNLNNSMGSPSEEERAISPERRSKPWDRKDRSRSPFRRDYGPRGRSRSPLRSDVSYRGRSRSPLRRDHGGYSSGRSPGRRGPSSIRSRSPAWRYVGNSDRSRSPIRREIGYRGRSPGYRRSRSRSRDFRDRRFRRPRSPSPYNDDGYHGGYRNWDLSPRGYDRGYGDSDSYGRHRRPAPEYLVSNFDFDNPVNSSLNYPSGPDYAPRPELPDPLELPEMVSIDYYADFLRLSEPNDRHSDNSIQKRYKIYQDIFNSRLIGTFFKDHQSEPWFREKYFPTFVKERLGRLRPKRVEAHKKFLSDLKSGAFDDVCYDLDKKARDEDKRKSTDQSTLVDDSSAMEDKPTSEQPADNEKTASTSDSQPAAEQLQTIFIKSVPPSISREQLLKVFENVEGFCHLMISEPSPFKRFHRIAWVLFASTVNVEEIVENLDKTTIDEFALHLAVHKQKQSPRLTNEIANTARRLNIDNHQAQKLARLFEKELGDNFKAAEEIEERLYLLFRKNRAENQGEPNEDIWETKKTLDLYLCYLRKVFSFCYYCCLGCDNDIELQRRCLDNHLRTTPRSSLNRPGEAWADALDAKVERKLMPDDDPDLEILGGKDLHKHIDEAVLNLIEEIGDTKFRCTSCNKLFKAIEFVKKHVKTKHPETFSDTTDEALFLNNYVRDPSRILPTSMPVADQAAHGMVPPGSQPVGYPPYNPGFNYPPGNAGGAPLPVGPPIRMGFPDSDDQAFSGQIYSGPRYRDPPRFPPQGGRPPTLQKDPRQLKSYVDLDAPAEGEMEFSYT